jgi:hypothetical protein
MKQLQPKKSPAESVSNPTPTKQEAPDDSLDLILDGSDEDEYTQEEYSDESEKFTELDETVQTLYEEQDRLMNLHMNMIQESANLLTVENKLLLDVQSDDYDVDEYALRLSKIVDRRFEMVNCLKERLELFQKQLKKEEDLSKKQYR